MLHEDLRGGVGDGRFGEEWLRGQEANDRVRMVDRGFS
jgi:hypothetical protein